MHSCRINRLAVYLVNGEHIEVSDVILLGIFDPGSALFLINQLPHILIHKLSLSNKPKNQSNSDAIKRIHITTHTSAKCSNLLDVSQSEEAPALAGCADGFGLWIEALGEVLVHATLSSWTDLRMALVQQHAV